MAAVDLYGSDASRLRQTYREQLGRDASDDEVSGWLSGSYGGGGVDSWVQQISGSDEARRRQAPPSQIPPPSGLPEGVQTTAPVIRQNPNVSRPMDDGDPWARAREGLARAREGLTNTYRQSLGRDPGDGDIDKWLSGQFGYGSGLQDYDKYVQAIMGSPEARSYRPPQTLGDDSYKSIEYWQQRGVPTIDMFDPLTGQLKQGWQRTARGYERTGAPTPPTGNVPGPQGGNYQGWFQQLFTGKRPSPRTLKEMEPILNQHGIRLGPLNARGFTDGIILPDGTFVDVILSATEDGGTGWGWIIGGGHGGPPIGGYPGGGPRGPGDQFNDPYTQFMEQLIKLRIGNLGPVNDPMRDQYMQAMQRRTQALQAAEPDYQRLLAHLEKRFTDLQGPGYTGAENEVLRTQALDPIERDRAAAKKRMLERISAMGHTLESGVAQQLLQEVDREFDSMRASTQGALASNDLQRRESRQGRADQIRSGIYDIGQARSREQLDTFGAIDALSALTRGENDSREREQISLAGALADLGPQRMQLALQAMGAGGSPQSMFQSLMQLAQMNQNSALLNSQNSGRLWSGLGSMAAILANAGR